MSSCVTGAELDSRCEQLMAGNLSRFGGLAELTAAIIALDSKA